jgi:serine protease Do
VGLIEPGTTVQVEVVRDRKRRKVKVTVGGLDADDSFTLSAPGTEENRGGRIGLVVENAPPETLERWSINGGVLVRTVVPGSPAAEAGILPGDVITLIGSSPVKNTAAFDKAVKKLEEGDSVPLRLIRRGSPMFIGLKLQE